jgi:hypothetical protein
MHVSAGAACCPQVDNIFNAVDPQLLADAASAGGDEAYKFTPEQFAAMKRDVEQLGELQQQVAWRKWALLHLQTHVIGNGDSQHCCAVTMPALQLRAGAGGHETLQQQPLMPELHVVALPGSTPLVCFCCTRAGATALDKRSAKAYKAAMLAKLGAAADKLPRMPAKIGLGMAKKAKQREAVALQEAIAAGMVNSKGRGKKERALKGDLVPDLVIVSM